MVACHRRHMCVLFARNLHEDSISEHLHVKDASHSSDARVSERTMNVSSARMLAVVLSLTKWSKNDRRQKSGRM
ncbi:hypothetical protein COOONC_23224 [Cooperia oncophora]